MHTRTHFRLKSIDEIRKIKWNPNGKSTCFYVYPTKVFILFFWKIKKNAAFDCSQCKWSGAFGDGTAALAAATTAEKKETRIYEIRLQATKTHQPMGKYERCTLLHWLHDYYLFDSRMRKGHTQRIGQVTFVFSKSQYNKW